MFKKNSHYVLVVIDEVDNSQPIRSFAQIFNELKRHGFPIFVLMTGLPDLIYVSQYRRRAIARHLVQPGSYGHVQYILPFFNEFIRATQDPDSIYFYGLE